MDFRRQIQVVMRSQPSIFDVLIPWVILSLLAFGLAFLPSCSFRNQHQRDVATIQKLNELQDQAAARLEDQLAAEYSEQRQRDIEAIREYRY